jgi:drug/metabolite transporter (DMT)-like permease
MKPAYLIILLVMNFFWGGVYSVYKVIGPEVQTGAIVTLRFGMAALCLAIAWPWLPGPAPKGKDLALSCAMGAVVFVLGQRLQVFGNHLGSAGNSAVLMAFEPLVTSVAAALFLREHIGPRRWTGFGLGLIGVAFLEGVGRPEFRWAGLSASLIFVSSFVCEAAYSVWAKPVVQRASVMKMLAVSLFTGTALNLALDGARTLRAAAALSPRSWMLLFFLAMVCTVVGYTLWFVVIRDCPVNVAALTVFSQAVFGVAIASVWVGEPVRLNQLAGGATIVVGLVVGLSRQIHSASEMAVEAAEGKAGGPKKRG